MVPGIEWRPLPYLIFPGTYVYFNAPKLISWFLRVGIVFFCFCFFFLFFAGWGISVNSILIWVCRWSHETAAEWYHNTTHKPRARAYKSRAVVGLLLLPAVSVFSSSIFLTAPPTLYGFDFGEGLEEGRGGGRGGGHQGLAAMLSRRLQRFCGAKRAGAGAFVLQ